jgi:hypothetical protein
LGSSNVRFLARTALLQLFEPLTNFAIDVGLSIGDLYPILRHAAVTRIATEQREDAGRVSISGIAAITGIPRAEISRILKSKEENQEPTESRVKSVNRILAAWHKDSRFTTPKGGPAELRIYGRGVTFNELVKRHGCGIPTRAILDELIRAQAIDLLPSQQVRARTTVVAHTGITPQMIRAFGNHAAELINTLVANMRYPDRARFIATASGFAASPETLPSIKSEILDKGTKYLDEVKKRLNQPGSSIARGSSERIGVTVFCYESDPMKISGSFVAKRRKNLRRRA